MTGIMKKEREINVKTMIISLSVMCVAGLYFIYIAYVWERHSNKIEMKRADVVNKIEER